MAHNEGYIDAPPERVFAVLSDPASYGDWVVGSQAVRGADRGFPDAGTRFHHRLGPIWPFVIDDDTEVLEVEPPRRLVLKTNAKLLGSARVELRLAPDGAGTRVTMIEEPVAWQTRLLVNPLTDQLVRVRNAESLRRLRRIAERRARA
jgi:uncharacterized protein YndB with AHSA1/START domain